MKKRNRIWVMLLLLTGGIIIFTNSCKKDIPGITKEKVTGSVQKGPFVNGTSVSMFELSEFHQTGNVYTTQILNNAGTFKIENIALSSSYVEFSASGYYFDEIKGKLSVAPLDLLAISDLTNISTVNVNILTHLEKQRVEYLIDQGMSFAEAKTTAQNDILGIFGFSLDGSDASETLDISINSEGNAVLLAISIILQGHRSVGDLTELMANISNDVREDGVVNDENIINILRHSTANLSLSTIRSNLEKRYQDLGISATIPDFEGSIDDFFNLTAQKPTIIILGVSNTFTVSTTLNGLINPNSLSTNVTFEYGTTESYGNSVSIAGNPLTGYFDSYVSVDISGLTPMTTYHYRVSATNSLGTTYGPDQLFSTSDPANIVTDLDGYVYRSIEIGNQIWMAENLRTTKYNDGTSIPKVTGNFDWMNLTTPGFSWYNNDSLSNYNTYGALYNYYAVNTNKLCPAGWHVPSDAEWTVLTANLGGASVSGGRMKEAGFTHWQQPNFDGTNGSGFTALPGGARNPMNAGFVNMGYYCEWWSSTIVNQTGYTRATNYSSSDLFRNTGPFVLGIGVRCVKD